MERGAILLLDEIDLGSPSKMMCLQSILEGKGYLIKRTGEYVKPTAGFNIIGTCNTKGQGDESGLFNATQILNEAMLDRFRVMFEAKFPSKEDEKKILMGYVDKFNISTTNYKIEEHVDILVEFANNVRDTIEKTNDIDHNISTRRLVGIIEGFAIWGDMEKSLLSSISRFDNHHKETYLKMWKLLLPENKKAKESEEEDYIKQFEKIEPF